MAETLLAPPLAAARSLPSPASVAPPRAATPARRRRRLPRATVVLPLLLLSFALGCALVPGVIASQSPTAMLSDAVLQRPGTEHLFGTDQFGRDMFALVVHGARQSLQIALMSTLFGVSAGAVLGVIAGYFGGWIDALLMRLADVWFALPEVLMAIAIATALGPGVGNIILAISVAKIPRCARVLRGQALGVRHQAFVEAARVSGASRWAILRGHVLPHCAAPILVLATLGLGSSILAAASLSFLGLGVNDEIPDWGYLLTQGRAYLTTAWWTVVFPGLAITTLVISVNLLGDALRRRLDPRQGPR
ncbi:ABC transporter permease [Roseateles sp.]|uniref:ABC transporter permease n=1 Tax=Roseateles sp. TaxID=1971397 RepID=UPI0039E80C65